MSELDQYDYDLPRELIAQHPLPRRSDARLMVVRRDDQTIDHAYIRDLPEMLPAGDCLVFNDTKVIPARLVGRRDRTGARWTGLFLTADEHGVWQVLSKTRGKLEAGEAIVVVSWDVRHSLTLRLLTKLEGGAWAVRPEPLGEPMEILEPHRPRAATAVHPRWGNDRGRRRRRIKRCSPRNPGAVAAPTAGLHFTPELLAELKGRGVGEEFVTLHVGVGTFRPIIAKRLDDHPMHSEWCSCQPGGGGPPAGHCAQRAAAIIAVGTTVARTLESAAQSGQIRALQRADESVHSSAASVPAIDGLLTNFHLPKSTLLILVRTFGGDDLLRRAYAEAIQERYRFFSYGDAMLIL